MPAAGPLSHPQLDALSDPRAPVATPGVVRPPALPALTSIRFFAALHVALYHLVRPFALWGLLAGAMLSGYSGVSFFFMLSGFVLTYAHAGEYERGRGNYRKFLVARFARIYPVYFLAMLVAAVLQADVFRQKAHWVAYMLDLMVLQSWSMRAVNFFNAGAWTLSCEAFFYVMFPLVLLRLRPRSRSAALGWVAVFFLLAIAAPLVCLMLYPAPSLHETDSGYRGESVVFLVSRLPVFAVPQFLAGISLGWFYLKFKPSERAGAVMASLGAVLFAVTMLLSWHVPYIMLHNGLLIPIYALLLLGLCQSNWLTRALSGSWLVLLGEASFSLYLFHILFINWTERMGVKQVFGSAVWRLAVVIPFTILLHVYVERPCRRAILGWYARRNPKELTMQATPAN